MTDEQRKERLNYHMYTTCETPAEHAERIVALEELCADIQLCLWQQEHHWHPSPCEECPREGESCDFERRMDELGIPRGQ
jgi:predicted molibdopterin-dependent oxidoreductase YjgC